MTGDFLKLPLKPGSYQAFVSWDTIEHLAHPEKFVERIADLLPAGGWLFFTTGDIGCRNARRRGARWRMNHPPTHPQYFNRETEGRLLKAYGFEVMPIEKMPIFRNLRSTLANLRVPGRPPLAQAAGLAAAVLPRRLPEIAGFWVDLGDIIFVAAQKAEAGRGPAV